MVDRQRAPRVLITVTLALGCTSPGNDTAETEPGSETAGDGDPSGDGDGDPSGDGDGDGDPSGDGDGVPSGDGDGDPPDPDCYFRNLRTGDNPISCLLPQPCPVVVFAQFGSCPDESQPVFDPSAAACIITELAAGTVGKYEIAQCPGASGDSWRLQLLGDGTVLFTYWEFADLESSGVTTLRAMPESSYFEGCSADTPQQVVNCFKGVLGKQCVGPLPDCPDP